MTRQRPLLLFTAVFAVLGESESAAGRDSVQIDGEAKLWHRLTLTFVGPQTAEDATPNPFRDYRLDVTFTHPASGDARTVPGYYAADGRAGETSATAGDRWRVHFSLHRTGTWLWQVTFRSGKDVAVSDDPAAGVPDASLNGRRGKVDIGPTDKAAPDFRARGTLEYVGARYLRFAGDGTYFLKGGVNSPETLLGYADFDGTYRDQTRNRRPKPAAGPVGLPSLVDGLHRYGPHVSDWRPGDPTWKGGKGKGLIGGLNYLAGQGVNAVYFLTMNVNGDGRNVWPWADPWVRDRFDCSKLDQWEVAFGHMTRLGIMPHIVLQETENDALLDRGDLGPERRLYLRELVARFSHHPAVNWNLGEENLQTVAQQKAMAAHLRALDPYRHHVVIHNDHWHAKNLRETFDPLLGFRPVTGPSIQDFHWNDVYAHVRHCVSASEAAGHPWVVCADELGGADLGTRTDADDPGHDRPRKSGLWATLMAGGAGVEWYFGWQNNGPHSDLSAEDWRTREGVYRQTRVALDFFRRHLPFHRMRPADGVALAHGASVLATPSEVYAVYLPTGGPTRIDLGPTHGRYEVKWFDPRAGGDLRDGPVVRVRGPGLAWTGPPPADPESDWLVVVRRISEAVSTMRFPPADGPWPEGTPEELGIDPTGLAKALAYWRTATGDHGVDRVAVVRRGVLIHKGKDADVRQNLYSATKSFTSTALGLLVADKKLSLDTPAADFEPALKDRYPRVTFRHFATMTSGYSAPGGSRWGEASEDWSKTPFTPGPPLFEPGRRFAYWDEAQMMYGRVLTRVANADLLTYLNDRVLFPIGVRGARWTQEGDVDGAAIRNGSTGLQLSALEVARFGHLYLSEGRWGGRQLVPAEWVREATRNQIGPDVLPADTDRRADGRGRYGMNWWVNGLVPGGVRALPDAPPGTYFAAGRHHNVCVIVPEWEMVLVRLGEDEEPSEGHAGVLNDLLRKLAPAVSKLEPAKNQPAP